MPPEALTERHVTTFPNLHTSQLYVSLESHRVTQDLWSMRSLFRRILLPVVDLSPLVMAIWSQWAI
jgi:hypothetical protein